MTDKSTSTVVAALLYLYVVGKFEIEDEAADAAAAFGQLPGWGRWGGAGIQVNKKKNNKLRYVWIMR